MAMLEMEREMLEGLKSARAVKKAAGAEKRRLTRKTTPVAKIPRSGDMSLSEQCDVECQTYLEARGDIAKATYLDKFRSMGYKKARPIWWCHRPYLSPGR